MIVGHPRQYLVWQHAVVAVNHFILERGAGAQRGGLGRGDHAIPQGGQHAGIGVAHVVEALGEVGYHVGRNPALGDHVVDAGFLGHVLAQQIDHKVHGLNGVQRRATALRTGGGVGGHPRKPELRRFIRERARRARGVVIPRVPMERHINVIKSAGAHQIDLARATLFGRRAIKTHRAGLAGCLEPVFNGQCRTERARAKEVVPAGVAAGFALNRFSVGHGGL